MEQSPLSAATAAPSNIHFRWSETASVRVADRTRSHGECQEQ
jgi:hypothetical protein